LVIFFALPFGDHFATDSLLPLKTYLLIMICC